MQKLQSFVGACLVMMLFCQQVSAAAPIVGVNVVGVDQQMTDEQQDKLIDTLRQHGVTTVRTALGGHGERYTRFVMKASEHGISCIVMLSPFIGNTGKHAAPVDQAVGRQYVTPALSDTDPDAFRKWFQGELATVEAAGVRLTAFELGNELNQPRFNGDFPIPGTGRVLGISALKDPKDRVGSAVAAGYVSYVRVLSALKDVRDHSKLNQKTAILSSMSANWGLPTKDPVPAKPGSSNQDFASVPDSIEFMRQHGLDQIVDGYSVHVYSNNDPRQSVAERISVLEKIGIFAACQRGGKPCWLTEYAFNNQDKSCPEDDSARVQLMREQREAFRKHVQQGRLTALIYYSWSGLPSDLENAGAIFRCGALTESGKLALSPM